MGQLITYIRHPTKIYNLSNRAIKYVEKVEKHKHESAPRHKNAKEVVNRDPNMWKNIKEKNVQLTQNMKKFTVESLPYPNKNPDKTSDALVQRNEPHPLPTNRKSLGLVLGYTEPKIIPVGKISVMKFLELLNANLVFRQALAEDQKYEESRLLNSSQSSQVDSTDKAGARVTKGDINDYLADRYALTADDVGRLVDYYKLFRVYVPGRTTDPKNLPTEGKKNVAKAGSNVSLPGPPDELRDDGAEDHPARPRFKLTKDRLSLENLFLVAGRDMGQIDPGDGKIKKHDTHELNRKLLAFKNEASVLRAIDVNKLNPKEGIK